MVIYMDTSLPFTMLGMSQYHEADSFGAVWHRAKSLRPLFAIGIEYTS